jgi:sugar/nucleoside kinase (ribokinase family)
MDKKLCVVGDAFVDVIIPTANIVFTGVSTANIKVICGGTANVAVGLSRLGVKTSFFGSIGNDAFGQIFKKDFKKKNIVDLTVIKENLPTGICISLVDKLGERSMIVNRGANDFIEIHDVIKHLYEISKSDMIFFTGYSFASEKTSQSIGYLMEEVSDKIICLNPGSFNILKETHNKIIGDYCDILILNLKEARAITGMNNVESILEVLESMVDIVALTMGRSGSIVSKKNKRVKTPAPKINKVVDTTGAGDAFSAGFLKGLLGGYELEECAKLGHNVAGGVIQRLGAR